MPEARDAARQHAIVAATDVAQAAKLLALASSKLAPQEYAIARIAAANLTEGSEVMLSETSRGTYAHGSCVLIQKYSTYSYIFEGCYKDGYPYCGAGVLFSSDTGLLRTLFEDLFELNLVKTLESSPVRTLLLRQLSVLGRLSVIQTATVLLDCI